MDQTVIKVRAGLALAERQIHDEDLDRIRSGRSDEPLWIENVSKQIWSTGNSASEEAWLGRSARSTR